MTTPTQLTKEIRQYKDFTAITNLRKTAQDILAPIVQTIENQMSTVLQESSQNSRKMVKMEEIFRNQNKIQKRIQEAHQFIQELREENMTEKKEKEILKSKQQIEKQPLSLQIRSLKTKIQSQQQVIQQINAKSTRISEMYTILSASTENTIKQLQNKFSAFTQEILDLSKSINQGHRKIQNEIQIVQQNLKKQREVFEEKTQPLELYMSQREDILEKLQNLESKLIRSISKDDLEGYRKSQALIIEKNQRQLEKKLEEIFPEQVRTTLPSVEQKLKELNKIKELEKQQQHVQQQIAQVSNRINENNTKIAQKIQKIQRIQGIQANINSIIKEQKLLEKKVWQQIQEVQQKIIGIMGEKMKELKTQVHEQIGQIIERQNEELQKKIQISILNNLPRSPPPPPQVGISPAKAEQIIKEAQSIKQIFSNLSSKFTHIEQISQTIDFTIQNYSSRITKIKSDYELFAESTRKQVSSIMKFKQIFMERFGKMGSLFSTIVQALFINTSIQIENMINNKKFQCSQSIIFTTQNDGIIYEWKPENKREMIQYRKQKLDYKQFLLSYMFTLVQLFDLQFSSLNFLNWEDQKPSKFFYNILDNYRLSKKVSQSRHVSQEGRAGRQSSTQLTYNMSNQLDRELQYQNSMNLEHPKIFFKTIDTNPRINKIKEQHTDYIKNYSIKRQYLTSGKQKNKDTTDQQSKTGRKFLTSRSACRSRISQLV